MRERIVKTLSIINEKQKGANAEQIDTSDHWL